MSVVAAPFSDPPTFLLANATRRFEKRIAREAAAAAEDDGGEAAAAEEDGGGEAAAANQDGEDEE